MGLKFYPYKGLFLGLGYGSVSARKAEVGYYLFTEKDEDIKKVREMVSAGHGFQFQVGYNLVGNLSKDSHIFFGISGGFVHDAVNEETTPSINMKIGYAW